MAPRQVLIEQGLAIGVLHRQQARRPVQPGTPCPEKYGGNSATPSPGNMDIRFLPLTIGIQALRSLEE